MLLACASFVPHAAFAAFDPTAGATSPTQPLPDPAVIYGRSRAIKPSTPGYISPLSPVQMPAQPLYPALVNTTPEAAPVAVATDLPPAPVISAPEANAVASPGYIAPPPPLTENPLAQPVAAAPVQAVPVAAAPVTIAPEPTPVAMVPPAAVTDAPIVATPAASAAPIPTPPPAPTVVAAADIAPVPAPAPDPKLEKLVTPKTDKPELTPQTRQILSRLPSHLDEVKPKGGAISVSRVSPEIQDVLGSKAKEESYESVGLSIKVRRPGLDESYELNRAYAALMGGDTDTAIEIYKNILSTNATSQDALFGLAATYHRVGNIDKARPLYGMLLKINPNHREALNNFLVLVSDESPQDALPELERLETRNPEFSPIPAQIAVVLDKLNYPDQARDKMLRAIELAPDNLTYKYNLAVMLDHQGRTADALALYKMLIDASLHGQAVPAQVASLQKRVNYLTVGNANPIDIPVTAQVEVPLPPASTPASQGKDGG